MFFIKKSKNKAITQGKYGLKHDYLFCLFVCFLWKLLKLVLVFGERKETIKQEKLRCASREAESLSSGGYGIF